MAKDSGGPVETWNSFVKHLIGAKESWEAHKESMMGLQLDSLPIEAQRQLRFGSIHKASDFARAMLQIINRWRTSGGLKELLIVLPKKQEKESNEKISK